jgi:hypothetical protein
MKKILSTTLALSLAMVSTVDAKKMNVTATTTKASDVLQAGKDLIDAKKDQTSVTEPVAGLVDTLSSPDMTPEQKELVAKRIEQADVERDIKLKKNEIADINYGWFGFGTTKEQQESYRAAKRDLVDLNAKLKNANSRIRELEVVTGKAWSNAVRFGIGALAAVGVVAIAYGVDQYKFEGKGMAAMREYAGQSRETVGRYAGQTKEAMGRTYRKYAPARLGGTVEPSMAAE